jgi:PAS domain S-box-containing protein
MEAEPDARKKMDTEGKPKKNLAEELESLRNEIAHLQILIKSPILETSPPEEPEDTAAAAELDLPIDILDNGPFGIAFVDVQFRIYKVNATLCRMLGYTQNEIESLYLQDVAETPADCLQLVKQVFQQVMPVAKTEVQFLKKGGETLWVQFTVAAIPKVQAGPSYGLIIIEDINDRKWAETTLQTEKQLLERLINSSVDGIVAFDRDGFFTVWNPGMERIFGIGAKETLGRPVFQAKRSFQGIRATRFQAVKHQHILRAITARFITLSTEK